MVVKGKIEKPKLDIEEERMKIIKQAAPVMSDVEAQQEPKNTKDLWTIFGLRITKEMSRQIDEALEKTVGITKTGFILQAIQEKIRKANE